MGSADKMKLSDLVDMTSPKAVFDDVVSTMLDVRSSFPVDALSRVFSDATALYAGTYPGYRGCNTEYHDTRHMTDTFLAMSRIVDGALREGVNLDDRHILLGLIGALLHDAGYIQKDEDTSNSGAIYTLVHVKRSADFSREYLIHNGYSDYEATICFEAIMMTDLARTESPFEKDSQADIIARMLGAADMLGQLADRTYLEKLLFLYKEFSEGHIMGFVDELDLLKKTAGFYSMIQKRLNETLGCVDRHLSTHFEKKWGIKKDLYQIAIDANISYLRKILADEQADVKLTLKRTTFTKKHQEN